MKTVPSFLSRIFSRRKKVIPCCIRGCKSKATHSAGVKNIVAEGVGGSATFGTIRAICDSETCLATMKRVEQTDQITLTPIKRSIYAVAA